MKKAREKYLIIQFQQKKDEKSFSELYKAFVDPIYRFIFFKVSNVEVAQDLTSEVFLRCWKDLNKNNSDAVKHFKPYCYKIARNLVIDYYRAGVYKKELQIDQYKNILGKKEIQKEIENKIEVEGLLNIIEILKESYKEIIVLKHIEQLSLSEISKIIDKSPVATRVLLHRANQALKREYEKITQTN